MDGHTLYVGGVATELVLTEGSKQLIGMGSWLIVWPDKKYINTGDLSQHGSLENRVQTQGQVTLSLCGAKGAALGDYLVTGAATVILAMGAGKKAAEAIDRKLQAK